LPAPRFSGKNQMTRFLFSPFRGFVHGVSGVRTPLYPRYYAQNPEFTPEPPQNTPSGKIRSSDFYTFALRRAAPVTSGSGQGHHPTPIFKNRQKCPIPADPLRKRDGAPFAEKSGHICEKYDDLIFHKRT
jgi:hypothetical protein